MDRQTLRMGGMMAALAIAVTAVGWSEPTTVTPGKVTVIQGEAETRPVDGFGFTGRLANTEASRSATTDLMRNGDASHVVPSATGVDSHQPGLNRHLILPQRGETLSTGETLYSVDASVVVPDAAAPAGGFIPSGGITDCNTNGIDDAIDVTSPVVVDNFGTFSGFVQTSYQGIQVRADDFMLGSPATVVQVEVTGGHTVAPVPGVGGLDTFTVRFWNSNATPLPTTVISSQAIPAGQITRTALGGGLFNYQIQLNSGVALPSGTRIWCEVFYSNVAFGQWGWGLRTAQTEGTNMVFSNAIPEVWAASGAIGSQLRLRSGSADINGNGIPDECEDCNTNGVTDADEIGVTEPDCNTSGAIDVCDIAAGTSMDCNSNDIPDECEDDCNTNGVADGCDASEDCNTNGVPDECDASLFGVNSYQQFLGRGPGAQLLFSDSDGSGAGGPQSLSDDFVLAEDTAVVAVTVEGGFDADPPDTTDAFTIRFWTDMAGQPGTVIASQDIGDAGITRTATVGGEFVFQIELNSIISLPAGTYWLQATYDGANASDWFWSDSGTAALDIPASPHGSFTVPENPWQNLSTQFGIFMDLRFGIHGFGGGDCNTNGIPDPCDIANMPALDLNGNGVIDDCEDCNTNGTPDPDEVGYADCNGNLVADFCDISFGSSLDCDDDGQPDECQGDCNTNGVADSCDILFSTANDGNSNGIPDDCEEDCNGNGVVDIIDIANATSLDCNTNLIPDECEADCNTNGAADDCDIGNGTSQDCNTNLLPDDCEVGFTGSVALDVLGANVTPANSFIMPDDMGVGQVIVLLSDPTPTGDTINVRAGDFQLVNPATVDLVTWLGAFGPEGAGDGSGDVFLLSWWTNSGTLPGTIIRDDVVASVRVDLGGGLFQFLAAVPPMDLDTEVTWLEIVYLGNAAGNFNLGHSEPNILSAEANSFTFDTGEGWGPSGVAAGMHIILGLHAVGDDCNTNGSPDECDITDDCNTDGVPDECEFDCNTNNINDACETDCNTNGLADVCDIGSGTSTDLDADGVPDDCQDCNANGVPDSLDISGVTSEDCNSNNVPDECDLDCNANGVADECDIAGDTSDDCNSNGIPDECDVGLFAGLQLNFEAEIPDGGSGFFLVAPINLAAGTGPIADVDIGVDIEHTWDSDLDLTAVHETTVVLLATAVGGSGDNFTGTVFDDEAATSITAGVAPFTGDFQPDPDLLSAFDGQSPSGFWALAVEDFVADDTGTLHSWTLFLTIGGGSDDLNTNGIPDECEEVDCATCPGDMNGDGLIDGDDIQCFVECKINGSTTTCTSCDCADPLTVGDFFDILLTGPNACP